MYEPIRFYNLEPIKFELWDHRAETESQLKIAGAENYATYRYSKRDSYQQRYLFWFTAPQDFSPAILLSLRQKIKNENKNRKFREKSRQIMVRKKWCLAKDR